VDVRNNFNSVSWSAIFQELCSSVNSLDQFYPFVWWFYAHPSPLYFPHIFQHGDFIVISLELRTQQRGPIGRNIVCFGSPLCSLPYNSSPPYLHFPFFGGWYTYGKSCIKCGSYVFMITWRVINIRSFSVANEMCSLVSLGIGLFYITSSWLSYYWFGFLYFGCTNGIHIICGWSSPWGSQDDI